MNAGSDLMNFRSL